MKSRIQIFLLLLFFAGNLLSQQTVIDSLKIDFEKQRNDTLKLKTLQKLSQLFLIENPDSSMFYAKKMLDLSLNLQMYYYVSDAYDLISNVYENQGQLEQCVSSCDSAKYYSNLINDPVGVIFFTNNKAAIYIKLGRYFEAIQSFEEVKSISERINRPSSLAAALNNIGVVYHYLGDDKTSLDYFIKAYELRIENNITKKLAYSLNNIGAIYSKYGNYSEALEYHKKAMQAAIDHNDDYNYLVALINTGLDYSLLKDYDNSVKYYQKALDESIKQGNKTLQSHALERMSAVYLDQSNPSKAKPLLMDALKLAKQNGNKYDIASFSNSLGNIYLKEKKYNAAHLLFVEALKISKEISASKVEAEAYKLLTAYYYSIHDSEKSFAYQKLFDTKRDSLYKNEVELKIANLKNRFELDRKLEELKQKEIELNNSKEESVLRLQIIYAVGVVGIILFILVLYIFILYQKIKIKNQQIRLSEEKVKQLLEQEKELGVLKTQLISMVSHEFRTPLAIIMSNAQLLRKYKKSMDDEMRDETLKFIESGVENMASMMRNFEVLDNNTILVFNPERVDISSLLTTLAHELQSLTNYGGRIKISNDLNLKSAIVDKRLITHIVRNLLINALKFSNGKQIEFEFTNKLGQIILSVKDKGIGMSAEDVSKIFDNFHRGSNVKNIGGTGVGMSVVKRCVDLHNGKIEIESKLGKGTRIKVTLPFET